MKILLATHNPNKVIEMKALFGEHFDVEVISMDEAGISEDIEEVGSSFEENALLKAQWGADLSGLICIADDSGLEVSALNNEPGIYSARYMGYDTPYTIKNNELIRRLEDKKDRSARYVCAVSVVINHSEHKTFCGELKGSIAYAEKGTGGFGYDPIFIPENDTRHYSELSLNERNQISHRQAALKQAIQYLKGLNL